MKGTHDYKDALTLSASPAGVLLATIAAPFIAAGFSEQDALHRAFFLTIAADNFITKIEMNSLRRQTVEMSTVDIDGALEYIGLKSDKKQLRFYLDAAMGKNEAATIWKKAIAGERVFTPDIWTKMKAAREQVLANRGKRATQKRSENAGKKKRVRKT